MTGNVISWEFTQPLFGPSSDLMSHQMLLMCWPCVAILGMILFTLGFYVGKWWQSLATRRLQRQIDGKAVLELDTSQDKKQGGHKHNEGSLDVKELRRRLDRQGKIDVFLAKSGTKVHFTRGCSGLNAADITRIQTKTLCGNCLRHHRLLKDDPEDAFSM